MAIPARGTIEDSTNTTAEQRVIFANLRDSLAGSGKVWENTITYSQYDTVIGSDGKTYKAKQSNVAEDPTTDTLETYWKQDISDEGGAFNVTPLDVDGEPITANYGFKNYIINGGFDIWQKGTSFTGFSHDTYCADRWKGWNSGHSANITQQTNQQLSGNLHANTVKTTATSSSANTYTGFVQIIEDVNSYKGKDVTLSLWIKTTVQSVDVRIDCGSFVYTVAVTGGTGVWQKVKISGNILYGSATQLNILIFTNNTAVNSGEYIEIANVQLEEGSVDTPFERRHIGLELILCNRYLPYRSILGNFIYHGSGEAISTTVAYIHIDTKVSSRITPTTVTKFGNLELVNGATAIAVTTVAINSESSTNSLILTVNVASGLTAGTTYRLRNANDATAYLEISTEL